MVYSNTDLETLLKRLRENQTELSTVEVKEELFLDTTGDRAYFIHHIVALANNVEPSCLIIGLENETWRPVGLPTTSFLKNADVAQNRMNEILGNKIDPRLSVQYRVYNISEVSIGVVTVKGKHAPYITAIEDREYGGQRTRGGPSYIYRGAVYVRHGPSTIVANRQSELLHIIKNNQPVTVDEITPDKFIEANKYLNPQSEDFGRHQLTKNLMEFGWDSMKANIQLVPAQSWVSYVIHPTEHGCKLDPIALKSKLKPNNRIGRDGKWYHGLPSHVLELLWEPITTPLKYYNASSWPNPLRGQPELKEIVRFIYIAPTGHIEYVCTELLYTDPRNELKRFYFLRLVGYLWQLIYFARAIYVDAGYHGEISILLNLIGTHGAILSDFAKSKQGGWEEPFENFYLTHNSLHRIICNEANIQIERRINLSDIQDDAIETAVRGLARDLGAYFGQDKPWCFDYDTDDFPDRQYSRSVH